MRSRLPTGMLLFLCLLPGLTAAQVSTGNFFGAIRQLQQTAEKTNPTPESQQRGLAAATSPTEPSPQTDNPLDGRTPIQADACGRLLATIIPSDQTLGIGEKEQFRKSITATRDDELLAFIEQQKSLACSATQRSPRDGNEVRIRDSLRRLCFLSDIERTRLENDHRAASSLAQQRCNATTAQNWIAYDPGPRAIGGRARYESLLAIAKENAARKTQAAARKTQADAAAAARKTEADAAAVRVRQAENTERDLDFKGIRLGDPLEAFLADKRSYACELYTNELAKCLLVYTKSCELRELSPALQAAFGLYGARTESCRTYADNSRWATIAGVPIIPERVWLYFLNGKLVDLEIGVYPNGSKAVHAALNEKYGKPARDSGTLAEWPSRGKTLLLLYGDQTIFSLANETDSELWTRKYKAKQQADGEAKIREDQRKRELDLQRRAKDL